jgi:hypothetical protein
MLSRPPHFSLYLSHPIIIFFFSRRNLDNSEDFFPKSLLKINMADTRPMSYLRHYNPSKNGPQRMNVTEKRNRLTDGLRIAAAINVTLISKT